MKKEFIDPLDAPEIRYRFKCRIKMPKRNGITYLFNRRIGIEMWNEWLKLRHEFEYKP